MAFDSINKRRSMGNRVMMINLPWPGENQMGLPARMMRILRYAIDSFLPPPPLIPFPPNCSLALKSPISGTLTLKDPLTGLLTLKDPITGVLTNG